MIDEVPTDVTVRIEPRCAHCPYVIAPARSRTADLAPGKGAYLGVLVEMQPGDDGVPWFLCVSCWLDGLIQGAASKGSGRLVEGDPAPRAGSEGDLRCQDDKPKKKRRSASN